jgi:DNA-binding response OmpR family regulator/Zn finger protein HypA/HybF involved in hydrogenase expression
LKCLIIDDTVEFGYTFCEILKIEGIEATHTTSAEDGLKQISENQYDIIFLDINMPVHSGIEMLKIIPTVSQNDPKCIMVTGYTESETIISAVNAGAFGYLTKPIDMEKLFELLNKIKDEITNKIVDTNVDLAILSNDEKNLVNVINVNQLSKIEVNFKSLEPFFEGLDIKENWININNILNSLYEKGLLDKEEITRVIICPSCSSLETYSNYICPSCDSIKIERKKLIQNIKNGISEEKTDFNDDFSHDHMDDDNQDFKQIGVIFECIECGTRYNKPDVKQYCNKCDIHFDYSDSKYVTVNSYYINDLFKNQILYDETITNVEKEDLVDDVSIGTKILLNYE